MRNINSLITVLALVLRHRSRSPAAPPTGDELDGYGPTPSRRLPGQDRPLAVDGRQWHFHVVVGQQAASCSTSEAYTSRTGAHQRRALGPRQRRRPGAVQVNKAATHGYLPPPRRCEQRVIAFTQMYSTKSSATRAISSCVRAVTSYLDKVEANTTGARVEVARGDRPVPLQRPREERRRSCCRRRATRPRRRRGTARSRSRSGVGERDELRGQDGDATAASTSR